MDALIKKFEEKGLVEEIDSLPMKFFFRWSPAEILTHVCSVISTSLPLPSYSDEAVKDAIKKKSTGTSCEFIEKQVISVE